MATSIFIFSMADNSVVRGWIWPNFEVIQVFMYIIVTCKYEKDPVKKKRGKCDDVVSPIISLWDF